MPKSYYFKFADLSCWECISRERKKNTQREERVETGSQGQRDPLGDEIGRGEQFSLTKSHAKGK